jgi:hypothetical protein
VVTDTDAVRRYARCGIDSDFSNRAEQRRDTMTVTVAPIILNYDVVAGPIVAHDTLVVVRINECIDQAYDGILRNRGGAELVTVSFVLEKAQFRCMNSRGGPRDLVGRDAEYYLKLRWRVSERPHTVGKLYQGAFDAFANGTYNALKAAMMAVGLEPYMRTDENVPCTPAGGVYWGAKGSVDGLSDDGTKKAKPARASLPTYPAPIRRPLRNEIA